MDGKKQALGVAMLLALALSGCTDDEGGDPQVLFETSLGDFTVELWPDKAPKTVENFLRYVDDGHYDGLTFHRIAPGFVVQGGGYLPDHQTLRPTRDPIVNEASTDVPNEKWTLSMARLGPDTATSQFFINLGDNTNLDKTAQSDGYAVFGKVISGFDTVDAMTEVEEGRSFGQAGGYYPKEPIIIEKATQIQGAAPDPLPPPGPADIRGDLITPGAWHVTNTQEAILAWADNIGGSGGRVDWSITGTGGSEIPKGWAFTFDDASQEIGADKSTSQTVYTMVRLTVPEGTSGDFGLELHTGNSTTPVVAAVELIHDRLGQEGDSVVAEYLGTCTKDGRKFDEGEYPLRLGMDAITGFTYGLVGMGLHEPATVVIPAALAYGDSSGPCASLDPADLTFELKIIEFSN